MRLIAGLLAAAVLGGCSKNDTDYGSAKPDVGSNDTTRMETGGLPVIKDTSRILPDSAQDTTKKQP